MTVHSEQSHQTQSTSTDELSLNGNYSYSDFTPDSGEISPDILPNITVDSAHSLWQRMIETKNKLNLNGKKLVAIATISTTALLATACSQEATPTETPSATSTSTPDTTPSPEVTQSPEAEFTVQSLEIPTGLDSEALGKALIEDRFTKWLNAGANQETEKLWMDYPGTIIEKFIPTVVGPKTEIIKKALFIENYNNSPLDSNIDADINTLSGINSVVLQNYLATVASDNPNNKEAYRQWYTVDSVNELKSNTPGSRNLVINYTEHNNSDKNIARPLPVTTGYFKITVQDDGSGHEKIAAIAYGAR